MIAEDIIVEIPRQPVRLATMADEEALVRMTEAMHEDDEWGIVDCGGELFRFNVIKARTLVQQATQSGRNVPDAGGAWIGVVGDVGDLRGSVYVTLQQPLMADGCYLVELWNWVYPDWRSSGIGDDLLGFATELAEHKGLRLIMAAMTTRRMAKARFYARRFGAPIGNVYNYAPSPTMGVAA